MAIECEAIRFVNVPDGNVRIIDAHAPNSTCVSVTWTGLPEEKSQGALQGYKILYKATSVESPYKAFVTYGAVTSVLIKDLRPSTQYILMVFAFNVYGDGRHSQPVNVTTQGNSALMFTGRGSFVYQAAYWAITDGEVTAVLRQVTKTTNSIQLEGLEAFTVYVVQVKVVGMNGTAGHIWGQAKISTDEAVGFFFSVPSAGPKITAVHNTSSTSIFIKWKPIPKDKTRGILLGYKLAFAEAGSQRPTFLTASSNATSAEAIDLEKFSIYVIVIQGYTRRGTGIASYVRSNTGEDVPSRPPGNVTAFANGTGVIRVTWIPVEAEFVHGILRGYKVRFKELAQTSALDWITETVGSSVNYIELSGLKPQTTYEVQVSAFTIRDGNYSESVIATTLKGPLSHPQNVTAHSTSPTSITVNWNRVIVAEVINASLCYLVQWTEDGNGVERNATANTTSYVITDLRMATEYNVCVATVHNAVISEFSSKVLVRTQDLQVPSSPPENVFVRTTNHSDLQITWSRVPSSAAHSVVIGYHVRVARENGKEIAIATCPFRANTSLSNLTVYQNYCVAVAAFSRRGIGPVSLRKCAVVDDGAICPPPQQLIVRNVTATNASLKLVYDGACVNASFVTGYRVTYSSSANRSQLEIPDARSTSVFLQNLMPNTTYQVEIMVLTLNGKDSVPSEPMQFITKES
ncbi:hypothetical protein pdam_00019117, partial [Pocillopora damicornis]